MIVIFIAGTNVRLWEMRMSGRTTSPWTEGERDIIAMLDDVMMWEVVTSRFAS